LNKRTILILTLVSIVLIIVGAVLTGASISTTTTTGTTTPSASGPGLAVYAIGGLVALVTWIMGLVKTAQLKRWGWFVEVLLLGLLGTLIYGIAGPQHPKS
jgi:hypothetical protein